jgi:hypothetical protein
MINIVPAVGALLFVVFSVLAASSWREYIRLRLATAAELPDHTHYSPASVRPSLRRLATLAIAETGFALVGFLLWIPLMLATRAALR